MHLFKLPLPEILLRVALAISFIYPAIAAIGDPYSWIGYFPPLVLDIVAPHSMLLLHLWGVFEVALAVWVLVGRSVVLPASLMAGALLVVVLANLEQFPVLFRDISIALGALALVVINRNTHGRT